MTTPTTRPTGRGVLRRVRLATASVGIVAGLVMLLLGDAGVRSIGLALLALGGVLLLVGRGASGSDRGHGSGPEQTPLEMWRSMDEGRDPTQT